MVRYFLLLIVIAVVFQNCEDPKAPDNKTGAASSSSGSEEVFGAKEFQFKPQITRSPDSYVRKKGQLLIFQVEIQKEYQEFATYRWYHNGSRMNGENSDQLELRNIQPSHAGSYKVVVSVNDSVLESKPGHLTVVDSNGDVSKGHPQHQVRFDQDGQVLNYNWSVTSFGECSQPCGPGIKRRTVTCLMKPAGVPTSSGLCLGAPPETVSECEGIRCGARHDFYRRKTQRRSATLSHVVSATDSISAERAFASACDSGGHDCGKFDRCTYPIVPGIGDDGRDGFCEALESGNYRCHAFCQNF